jgi:lipopolysaccharide export system protein LptC
VGERLASWFAILLMLGVLATSYWYAQTLRGDNSDSGRIGTVDFFAERIALTGFDAIGKPRYRLFADRMVHYGNSDNVDLVQPKLLSMRPEQPQVQAVAREAHAQNNAETVEMVGDVVVTRAPDAQRPAMRLETQEMTVVPDDDHFWTEEPVRMTSGTSVMTGRGMDYDNVSRHVELHSDVVGSFPPKEKP